MPILLPVRKGKDWSSAQRLTGHVLGALGEDVLLGAYREDVAGHLRSAVQRARQHHVRAVCLEQLEYLHAQKSQSRNSSFPNAHLIGSSMNLNSLNACMHRRVSPATAPFAHLISFSNND